MIVFKRGIGALDSFAGMPTATREDLAAKLGAIFAVNAALPPGSAQWSENMALAASVQAQIAAMVSGPAATYAAAVPVVPSARVASDPPVREWVPAAVGSSVSLSMPVERPAMPLPSVIYGGGALRPGSSMASAVPSVPSSPIVSFPPRRQGGDTFGGSPVPVLLPPEPVPSIPSRPSVPLRDPGEGDSRSAAPVVQAPPKSKLKYALIGGGLLAVLALLSRR